MLPGGFLEGAAKAANPPPALFAIISTPGVAGEKKKFPLLSYIPYLGTCKLNRQSLAEEKAYGFY